MNFSLRNLLFAVVALVSFLILSGCSKSKWGDGDMSGSYYGPSSSNTVNYTDQKRSDFRNNW